MGWSSPTGWNGDGWARPASAGGLGLQTNLVSFWELENTSWTDAVGSNNMTGGNSPTTTTGRVGNAVQFVGASSQFLTHVDNATLRVGGVDFSIAFWALADSFPSSMTTMSKGAGFGNAEFSIGTEFTGTGNQFIFSPRTNSGSSSNDVPAATFGNLAITTWYFVVCTYNNSTDTVAISVNATTPDTLHPTLNPPIVNSTGNFEISSSGVLPWDGRIDQVGLWKNRILSSSDITALYNGGAGLSFAQML